MNKYAYIEIVFGQDIKNYFSQIVKELVPKGNFYYSTESEYAHINGDVTQNLHCTLFFGIDPDLVKDKTLIELVKEANFNEIELGKLVFFNGYQGFYKILCIEILNKDNRFTEFAKKVEDYVNDKDIKYEVKPHLTLAYVMPEYEIKKYPKKMIKKIKSKKIQISIQK